MNERTKLTKTIVKVIEGFPKVYKFLTEGDSGCHPQHLVDTIVRSIVSENDITSQVTVYDYNDDLVSISKCVCGHRFKPWEFILWADKDNPKQCPKCNKRMYCSIQVRVYEAE